MDSDDPATWRNHGRPAARNRAEPSRHRSRSRRRRPSPGGGRAGWPGSRPPRRCSRSAASAGTPWASAFTPTARPRRRSRTAPTACRSVGPPRATAPSPTSAPPAPTTAPRRTRARPAGLVRIMSTLGYQDGEAAGTGMILTSDGEVVTNHHVVAGATSVKATVMSTGKTYTATVVGSDTKDDVAVLQLADASGLTTVTTDSTLPGRGRRRDRGRRRQRHRGPPQRRHGRGDGPRRADHHAERGQHRGTDAHRADRDQQRRDLRRLRRRDVRRAGRGARDDHGGVERRRRDRIRDPDREGARDRRRPAQRRHQQPLRLRPAGVPGRRPRRRLEHRGRRLPGHPRRRGRADRGRHHHRRRRALRSAPRPRSARPSPGTSPATRCGSSWTDTSGSSHTATVTLVAGPVAEPRVPSRRFRFQRFRFSRGFWIRWIGVPTNPNSSRSRRSM